MSGDERTKQRPALQTKRLILRRPDATDVGSIMAIVGDWEVACRLSRVLSRDGRAVLSQHRRAQRVGMGRHSWQKSIIPSTAAAQNRGRRVG